MTPLRSPAEIRRRSFAIILHIVPFCCRHNTSYYIIMCTSMFVVHSQSHFSGRFLWRHRTKSVCRLCVVLPYDNRRQCGNCLREYPLFFRRFRRFCPVEDDLIAVTAVLDGTVDAADRGSACTGFLDDFMKDVSAVEHFCHL